MSLFFFIAKPFPRALPPTVTPATKPVITSESKKPVVPENGSEAIIIAAVDPLIMPQISPITSLHILETFSAFLTSQRASFAPRTRFEDIALKGFSEALVVATPKISKIIPKKTKAPRIKNAGILPTFKSAVSDIALNATDKKKLPKRMVNDQRKGEVFSFFEFLLRGISDEVDSFSFNLFTS